VGGFCMACSPGEGGQGAKAEVMAGDSAPPPGELGFGCGPGDAGGGGSGPGSDGKVTVRVQRPVVGVVGNGSASGPGTDTRDALQLFHQPAGGQFRPLGVLIQIGDGGVAERIGFEGHTESTKVFAAEPSDGFSGGKGVQNTDAGLDGGAVGAAESLVLETGLVGAYDLPD